MPIKHATKDKLKDYTVTRCRRKQGCTLNLQGIQPYQRTIVDCDEYRKQVNPDHKICDYIIVCELQKTSVSVIEMKSKTFSATAVKEQLQQGARLAELWLGDEQIDVFLPAMLSSGGHRHQLKELANQRVLFRNTPYPISAKQHHRVTLRQLLQEAEAR